MVLLSAMLIKD